MGYSVLFIDLDPQGNLTDVLMPSASGLTISDVMNGKATAKDAAIATEYGDLIRNDPNMDPEEIRPDQLAEALSDDPSAWDYCVIDNGPSLNSLTICSIYAADFLILPTQAARFGIKAVNQMLTTIRATEEAEGHAGSVLGVLLTQYNTRAIISKQARQSLRESVKAAGSDMFTTEIRQCVSIPEAQAAGTDVYSYAPRSNAAIDYRAVTTEMLERIHARESGKGKR